MAGLDKIFFITFREMIAQHLNIKLLSFLAMLLLNSFLSYAQVKNVKENKKKAKTYLSNDDYNRALKENLILYKENKNDAELNRSIGICYLNINDDRSKAIPYLEYALKSGKMGSDIYLYLGMAYMYSYDFDKAISYFNEYRSKKDAKEAEQAELLIKNCSNAKEMVKHPVNVSFENLGKDLNTIYPDYYPFVTENEGTMYFTSRRDATMGNIQSWQGYYTSDIYVSKVVNGEWGKAKNMGALVNSQEDEQCVYMTPDGKIMMVYVDNTKTSGDLFLTSIGGKVKAFPKPIPFEEPINTDYSELEGCINTEGNTIIFASDRNGGVGNMDLYMTKKLPNGSWGKPVNLGNTINTEFNEGFPVFDEVNQVLYFSSEGHYNMGGYDIFKSKYDTISKTFSEPVNMGYPINTPEDNMQFSLAGNRRDAYISAYRKEGYGDLDIYKVIFHDVESRMTALKGKVKTADSSATGKEVEVSILNETTKEVIDTKTVKMNGSKFLFALEPGNYIIEAKCEGYLDLSEKIAILDKANFVSVKTKNLELIDKNKKEEPPVKKTTPKKPVKK